MKVMNSEAPSSAPRIGRNESDRNLRKNESSQAIFALGLLAPLRPSPRAAVPPAPPPAIPQRLDLLVDRLHPASDDRLIAIPGLRDSAHHPDTDSRWTA